MRLQVGRRGKLYGSMRWNTAKRVDAGMWGLCHLFVPTECVQVLSVTEDRHNEVRSMSGNCDITCHRLLLPKWAHRALPLGTCDTGVMLSILMIRGFLRARPNLMFGSGEGSLLLLTGRRIRLMFRVRFAC